MSLDKIDKLVLVILAFNIVIIYLLRISSTIEEGDVANFFVMSFGWVLIYALLTGKIKRIKALGFEAE